MTTLHLSKNKITESIQRFRQTHAEYRKALKTFHSIKRYENHFLSLVKVENRRDHRRVKKDRKDKSHDRWMYATHIASAVTPFLVAGAAVLALRVGLNPNQKLSPFVYVLAASAAGLTSATRGKGFLAMKLQDADFAQKSGEHHDKRRSRAYELEVLTLLRCFEKMNAIREENDQLTVTKLYAWHKWMLKRKIRDLYEKKEKIDKFIKKMENRNDKVKRKEHKDGKESSYDFNRLRAKGNAIKSMVGKGFPETLVYQLVDPEFELPRPAKTTPNRSVMTTLREYVDKVPFAKRIRERSGEAKEIPSVESVFQRIGRQMLNERCFDFPSISSKLGVEIGRFEGEVMNR